MGAAAQYEPPRRCRLDRMTAAERAICEAVRAVEAAGCDERLTAAVVLLAEARERVADFVDGVPARKSPEVMVEIPESVLRGYADSLLEFYEQRPPHHTDHPCLLCRLSEIVNGLNNYLQTAESRARRDPGDGLEPRRAARRGGA